MTTDSPADKNPNLMARNETINILVAINCQRICNNYPNPSQNPEQPTELPESESLLISDSPRGVISHGSTHLNASSSPGDDIYLGVQSICGSLDHTTLLYQAVHVSGAALLHRPELTIYVNERSAMTNPQTHKGLPPVQGRATYGRLLGRAIAKGTALYAVRFALYRNNTEYTGGFALHGYFSCPVNLTLS